MKKLFLKPGILLIFCVILLATPLIAQAHVKWFVDFSFADPPRSLGDVFTPAFIALTVLSFVALALGVFIEQRLKHTTWYQRIVEWFSSRREYSVLVMRIGLGVTLLLAWQADTLLTPDLDITEAWIGWLQFVIAGLLLFRATTPIAGAGTLVLYAIAISKFGAFYMLDYFLFVGIGVYLLVSTIKDLRIRAIGIPALYFSVGFSLMWVALEKLVYPQWGLYILDQNPQLSLGFDVEFFLQGAAFVELVLGYLLIIGLLERPIALAVTLVFFGTTLVFGKVEVIGHTIIHAALIVFLLEGPGQLYPAPVNIHKRLGMRMAFASVNFVLLLVILLVPYERVARMEYDDAVEQTTLEIASEQ